MSCTLCATPAKRKCTRCGQVFCNRHIRYGNPHFAFAPVAASVGHYCDACWQRYATLGQQGQRRQQLLLGIIFSVFGVFACFVLSSAAFVLWQFLQIWGAAVGG